MMQAWDLLTPMNMNKIDNTHLVRIVGGRTLYESARNTRNDRVCLSRLETDPLRQINRYIDWDTPVELVEIEG